MIIDRSTYLAVLNAAPDIPGEYDRIAWDLVNILRDRTIPANINQAFYQISLKDLCGMLDLTPSLCGRIVAHLGLSKQRRRDGYYVFFTCQQVAILTDALRKKRGQ